MAIRIQLKQRGDSLKIGYICLFFMVFVFVNVCGTFNINDYKHFDSFEGNTSNYTFTIINADPMLTEEYIRYVLKKSFIDDKINYTILDGISDPSLYTTELVQGEKGFLHGDGYTNMPIGVNENTVLIVNENHPIANRKPTTLGGTLGNRAMAIHKRQDDELDIGIRILHETEHCLGLDADGLYWGHNYAFYYWCVNTSYPYTRFLTNRNEYIGIKRVYDPEIAKQVELDYNLWLLVGDKNG